MTTNRGFPDYILEQYILGELPPEKSLEIDERIRTDRELASHLEELRSSDERILRIYPPAQFAQRITGRVLGEKTPVETRRERLLTAPRWLALAPALAAVAVIAIVLVRPLNHSGSFPDPSRIHETTRTKGLEPQLKIYHLNGKAVDLLGAGSEVAGGEVLQISYIAAGRKNGVILSIDGRGAVTLHYPEEPALTTELDPNGETPVPHAYEIDDAPEFERFFLVTACGSIHSRCSS